MVMQDASDCQISAASFWKLDGWKPEQLQEERFLILYLIIIYMFYL